MPDTDKEPNAAQTIVILAELLGPIIYWKRPTIQKTVGPYNPSAFEVFENKFSIAIEHERKIISNFLLEYKSSMFDENGKPKPDVFKLRMPHYRKLTTDLMESQPDWFAGGFGNEGYAADFEYWSTMERLSLIEAVCLSIGFDPKFFNNTNFNIPLERGYYYCDVPQFFFRRLNQFQRNFDIPNSEEPIIPARDLADWIIKTEIEVHSCFLPALQKHSRAAKISHNSNKMEFSGSEKQTLLKLIAAMSVENYGFIPSKPKNEATGNIRSDLEIVGLSLDNKTILHWLREAAKLVDDKYWDSSG